MSVVPAKDNYMRNNLMNHRVKVEYQKEDLPQVNHQLYEWLATVNDKSSEDSITQPEDSVNSKFSISEEKSSDIRYSIDETPETPDVSDSAFDDALRRAGLSHLVEDTAETGDTETAPPPRKPPESATSN